MSTKSPVHSKQAFLMPILRQPLIDSDQWRQSRFETDVLNVPRTFLAQYDKCGEHLIHVNGEKNACKN